MEKPNTSPTELLKEILAHLRKPDSLNDHPWAISTAHYHQDTDKSAGEYLVQ
ncbi:MAG: hypothetical protein HOP27_14780, partial [Anaerolineales bacterium]|nr:hypothetical protein [Anaerolineales bacterium]